MSAQALDLKRAAQIVRRHSKLVGAVAALGLLAGAGYTAYRPPMLTSDTLVVVPNAAGFTTGTSAGGSASGDSSSAGTSGYMATQMVIADSEPVLLEALPHAGAAMSLATLRSRVQVTSVTSNVISIKAKGQTAAQAEAAANAVAGSYVAYLDSGSSPVGHVQARILGHATTATGTPLYIRLLETGGTGVLAGGLIGAIIALAIGRSDRRLRERDQIADSIGVPVLASVRAEHPRDAADWARLFEHYRPSAVDAWRLHKALHQLGLVGMNLADSRAGSGSSLAVLSLSSDRKALALGPQLAAFAASLGIPAALVVGPQQDENATATLHAACAAAPAPSKRSGNLLVAVSDLDNAEQISEAALTVVVAVVDERTPRVADTMRTAATVVGMSAGAATAEQLARVAASVAADGRDIAGILVGDPDPADQTTGRVPQLSRSGQRGMPTRITRAATETRR